MPRPAAYLIPRLLPHPIQLISILARSGLVQETRNGRSIVYRADVEGMRALIAFMVTDCCEGHPELCNLHDALRERTGCVPATKGKQRRK